MRPYVLLPKDTLVTTTQTGSSPKLWHFSHIANDLYYVFADQLSSDMTDHSEPFTNMCIVGGKLEHHSGEGMPVSDFVNVEVFYRGDSMSNKGRAGQMHGWEWNDNLSEYEIIAFRVLPTEMPTVQQNIPEVTEPVSSAEITPMQKIETSLALQDEVNSVVAGPEWRTAGNEWYRAIYMEATEAVDHIGYKWWKKNTPRMVEFKIELVDIWHFMLSDLLEQEGKDSSFSAAAEVMVAYQDQANSTRETGSLLSLLDALIGEVLMFRNVPFAVLRTFFKICFHKEVQLDFDLLYDIYVKKNVLNKFRQDNGYQKGNYVKNWDGGEDNDYLEQLDSSVGPEELYIQLGNKYKSVLNQDIYAHETL